MCKLKGHSKSVSLLALMVGLTHLVGCSTYLKAPESVSDPVVVALLDYGRHPSLVVQVPGRSESIHYAYGDWNYFALNNKGTWNGFKALFWPTPSTLGQKQIMTPLTPAALGKLQPSPVKVYIFEVEAEQARQFHEKLQHEFACKDCQRHKSSTFNLEFIKTSSTTYWLLNNSNQVTARWLKELGIQVSGPALLSSWRIPSS